MYATRLNEAQKKVENLDEDNRRQNEKIKALEDRIAKLTTTVCLQILYPYKLNN